MTATVDTAEARRALKRYVARWGNVQDDQLLSTLALADSFMQYAPLLLDELDARRKGVTSAAGTLREAASWHGLATNLALPQGERFECALKALDLYESAVEQLRGET